MIWIALVVPFMLAKAQNDVTPEYLDQLRASGNDEEFAKLFGIDVRFVRSKNDGPEGSIMNRVSPLGDVMLTAQQEEQARQGLRFEGNCARKWPYGIIPYVINKNDFSPSEISVIESAIDDFNRKVNRVKIVPRSYETNYVYIFSGNGCWSSMGRTNGGQLLSLQKNGCVYMGTIQHELIHTAGFTHQHNRSDRDKYIEVLYENIPEGWRMLYNKFDPEEYGLYGPYDYYSVMHYGMAAPGTGKPAFKILKSNIDESRIGRAQSLTYLDALKMDMLYS